MFALLFVWIFGNVNAQSTDVKFLDSAMSTTTITIDGSTAMGIASDGTEGYTRGDKWVVVQLSEACPGDNVKFSVNLLTLGLHPVDTFYIYDGTSITAPLLLKAWGDTIMYLGNILSARKVSLTGLRIYVSPTNTTNALTIRINALAGGAAGYSGFTTHFSCYKVCETITPKLEPYYTKTRNGVPYATMNYVSIYNYDTIFEMIYDSVLNDSVRGDIIRIDTAGSLPGALICLGDGIIMHAKGQYTHLTGWYTPTDSTTTFTWTMGNNDIISAPGATDTNYAGYRNVQCYDVGLDLVDERGCRSTVPANVQVRIAQNPMKTIFTLATTCNTDSLQVNIGYDGDNATITLRKIEYAKTVSKIYMVRTFIPDGKCVNGDQTDECYQASVTFEEFPAGRRITKGSDICSICVNYEHSFMGDYRLSIKCPTGQEAVLKYGNRGSGGTSDPMAAKYTEDCTKAGQEAQGGDPYIADGMYGGGGAFTGVPFGGCTIGGRTNDGTYDQGEKCDSTTNMFGIGMDYCFSRNSAYTLVSGNPANIDPCDAVPSEYIAATTGAYTDTVEVTQWPEAPGEFSLGSSGEPDPCLVVTRKASNYEEQKDYYLPASDFSSLIGCPLNGDWSIQLCDFWGADNGWVFYWSMDICNVNQGGGCEYQVGIDSVVWYPDPDERYHDYDLGHYRGLLVHKRDESRSFLLTPDTAGTFPIIVKIYDEFGCIWDTVTKLTTVWTPTPSLGNDTLLCSIESIVLDASDRHSVSNNFSYVWEPNGQVSDTIHTDKGIIGERYYVAEVTNKQHSVRCTARDTCLIRVNRQPVPNFDPGIYPLEGCAPYTVTFKNTSTDGHHYFWDFGDGVTSTEESPRHIFGEGSFDFRYYIYSVDGCVDSLIFPNLVTVFPKPQASFSWTPTYPTVLSPYVQFVNHTVPDHDDNRYYWEIQYNRAHPLSVQTEIDKNPYFNWYRTNDEDLPGSYIARLIARTDNIGPSGEVVYCYDTTENTILLVNDFLQFPNVVTPNGDGVNDRFVIKNLVDGLGFPINQLDIYNKWGTLVFHRENIATYDDFWDPNTNSMPAGTYFYRFSARGYNGNIEHNGTIEVIR